jgi:hypothetical protein
MRAWTRLCLGLGILAGRKYGIIVDQDYARGGVVYGFSIAGPHIGILAVGGREDMTADSTTILADNRFLGAWDDDEE